MILLKFSKLHGVSLFLQNRWGTEPALLFLSLQRQFADGKHTCAEYDISGIDETNNSDLVENGGLSSNLTFNSYLAPPTSEDEGDSAISGKSSELNDNRYVHKTCNMNSLNNLNFKSPLLCTKGNYFCNFHIWFSWTQKITSISNGCSEIGCP